MSQFRSGNGWELDEQGTLTVRASILTELPFPWTPYTNEINNVVLEEGVTDQKGRPVVVKDNMVLMQTTCQEVLDMVAAYRSLPVDRSTKQLALCNYDLSCFDLSYQNLEDVNFYGSYLAYADLHGAKCAWSHFEYSNLFRTDMRHSDLRFTKFAYNGMSETNISNSQIDLARFVGIDPSLMKISTGQRKKFYTRNINGEEYIVSFDNGINGRFDESKFAKYVFPVPEHGLESRSYWDYLADFRRTEDLRSVAPDFRATDLTEISFENLGVTNLTNAALTENSFENETVLDDHDDPDGFGNR